MCRLLLIKSLDNFEIESRLKIFAEICKTSKEYQGHGWGAAYLEKGKQKIYRSIKPIWEDNLTGFGETDFLLVHARSAFRDEGIKIENNMPFSDEKYTFIFNGELQGVRIREDGRIGAEKIFNFIRRFDKGDMNRAFAKGVGLILKKTRYVRAINIIMTDFKSVFLSSIYNEDPDYFAMHRKQEAGQLVICSQPFPGETGWQEIANNTVEVFK